MLLAWQEDRRGGGGGALTRARTGLRPVRLPGLAPALTRPTPARTCGQDGLVQPVLLVSRVVGLLRAVAAEVEKEAGAGHQARHEPLDGAHDVGARGEPVGVVHVVLRDATATAAPPPHQDFVLARVGGAGWQPPAQGLRVHGPTAAGRSAPCAAGRAQQLLPTLSTMMLLSWKPKRVMSMCLRGAGHARARVWSIARAGEVRRRRAPHSVSSLRGLTSCT